MEAEALDFTKFEDGFVFHFGGELNRVNADTFAKSWLEFSNALKEINQIADLEFETEIYIEATSSGSFRIKFTGTVGTFVLSVIAGIFGSYIYDNVIADSEAKIEQNIIIENMTIEGDVCNVNAGKRTIRLPKEAAEAIKKIGKNQKFKRHVSNAFKKLESDSEIYSFGISIDTEDSDPLIEIERNKFYSQMIRHRRNRTERVEAELLILKAIFENSRKNWQFVWKDGKRISAPILDDLFLNRIVNREHIIGSGDTLQAIMRINHYEEENGVSTSQKYQILKVLSHRGKSA